MHEPLLWTLHANLLHFIFLLVLYACMSCHLHTKLTLTNIVDFTLYASGSYVLCVRDICINIHNIYEDLFQQAFLTIALSEVK